MKYLDLLKNLENDKIISLIKEKKINWVDIFDSFDVRIWDKINSFNYQQLQESGFEKALSIENMENIIDNASNDIKIFFSEYLKKNGLKKIKDIANSSEKIIEVFLNLYPEKREDLIKEASFSCGKNISLLKDKSIVEVADFINKQDWNYYTLKECLKDRKEAPLNTIIRDEYYSKNKSVSLLLMDFFPRDIPFSYQAATSILEQDRELFFKLPMRNQADANILNFTTNNIFPASHDADYPREDPQNLNKKRIPANILDHIENDENGLYVALYFLKINKKYISHKNIQKLIDNPLFTEKFEDYRKLLKPEHQNIFPVYEIDNIPKEKFTSIGFNELKRQKEEVIVKIMLDAENKGLMLMAFGYGVDKKINFSKVMSNEQKKHFLKKNLNTIIDHCGTEKVLGVLLDIVISNEPKDFKNILTLTQKCNRLEDVLKQHLTVEQSLEYLEFKDISVGNKRSKKNKMH